MGSVVWAALLIPLCLGVAVRGTGGGGGEDGCGGQACHTSYLIPCLSSTSLCRLSAHRLPPELPEGPGAVCAHLCGPGVPGLWPAQEAAGAQAKGAH